MNQLKVKICGLTRGEDVDAAVQAGADALGFVFVPASKRCVELSQAKELCKRVPVFISRVGLFLNQPANDVWAALDQVGLSILQFHGTEDAQYCRQFRRPYIKSISLLAEETVEQKERLYPDAVGILVDSHQPGGLGGTGKTLDWSQVQAAKLPLILAGGLTPENVSEAIRIVRPWAVDVSSGVEVSPGIKDAHEIMKFISEAKSEY